jgi:hypothetical protein
MTGALIAILQTLAVATPVAGGNPEWRHVFEGRPAITAVRPASSFPGVDLARPLMECPAFPALTVEAVAAFNLQLDLGGGRHPDIDVFVGKLPVGVRAHEAVIGAGQGSAVPEDTCVLSKRGVSYLQMGHFWIGLPTLCRKGYYEGAVSVVLAALHAAHPEDFPREFIYGPCGAMRVRATPTDAFLRRAAALPSNKALQTDGASRRR